MLFLLLAWFFLRRGDQDEKNMSLSAEIREWDERLVDTLELIYEQYSTQKMFASDLIFMVSDLALQKGATWLLKKHLELGNKIDAINLGNLFKHLEDLHIWESKLHVLQCLPFVEIPAGAKEKIEWFLRQCLPAENKFIRAWAYNGFYELSRAFPEYEAETRKLFEMALRDEAPSIQSRIRHIMNQGF